MEEWKEYNFTEIATIISGGTPKTSNREYWDGDIPWLSVKDFGNDLKYVYTTERQITKLGLDNSPANILSKDDIILSARGTVGELSMIPFPMSFNQSCFGLRAKDIVDAHFLYYLMKTKVRELKNNSHGSVFDTITRATLDNLTCRLPSLNLQKQIARCLSTLDDKIELNRKINDNLEQQAQVAFNNIVAQYSECETINLSEIAILNPKRTIAKGTLARSIEMAQLSTSSSFPAGWDMKEYNGGIKFQNGDTLMARITPCLENGKVAYINFLEENEVAFGSTEYIVIASRGVIEPEVFYFLTRHTDFVDFAVKNMNGSSGRQRVSAETIGTYKLPVFSPEDMVILETIAKEALNKIKYNSLENIRLSEIRDTLLPKLMSGEFKINEIDC